MLIFQRLRALAAEPNWLENRLYFANVTMPLDEMPADWLAADQRNEVAAWWLSAAKSAHITAIREGLSDGTLL
jgi:hypothetical protein